MLLSSVKNTYNEHIYTYTNNFIKNVDIEIDENVEKIDLEESVIITDKNKYNYKDKYLVVGLGSNVDNGFYWNEKINEIKELYNEPNNTNTKNICIIGSGPTGTELAFYLNDMGFNITILDADKKENLYKYLSSEGKEKILNEFKKYKITLHDNTMFNETIRKNYDYNIFAIGSRSNDLTSKWSIDSNLKLVNYDNIFSGGDCIMQQYPKNAQVAYQQGVYIAKYLNNEINEINENKNPLFSYDDKGIALYIGDNKYYVEINSYYGVLQQEINHIFIELYYKIFK